MNNPLILIVALAAIVLLYAGYRVAQFRANLKFEQWKNAYSRQIRRDAITGSQAAVAGRVFERVAPYLPGFGYNPKDIRFLGDPVDFVVFDGLSEGNLRNVVFVEVKTGVGDLNTSERRVRAAIMDRRVAWSLYRLADGQPEAPLSDLVSGVESTSGVSRDTTAPNVGHRTTSAFIDRGRF